MSEPKSPYEDGSAWVCWSNKVPEHLGRGEIHAQSVEHGGRRTLCGVNTEHPWWDFEIHGCGGSDEPFSTDGPGVTCRRCLRIIEKHGLKPKE